MEKNNYILGAGINGLIAAHYLKDYKIIGFTNCQEAHDFPLGPRYIHYSENVKELLSDLKLSTDTEIVKIGYFLDGAIENTATDEFRKDYFYKTRGKGKPFKSSMSGDKNKLKVFKVKPDELYKTLLEKYQDRVIKEKITSINRFKLIITTEQQTYEAGKIVTTLPAPIFFRLTGEHRIAECFKAKPKIFYLVQDNFDFEGYDYIYFADADTPMTRATKFGTHLIAEVANIEDCEEFEKQRVIIKKVVLPNAQITNKAVFGSLNPIKCIGRFACWKHNKKINEVVEDVRRL